METVSHRELRNNSGKVLERVRNGETVAVTNHGELAAVLVPPHLEAIDRLTAAGRVRMASAPASFGLASRLVRATSTGEMLSDLRGER